MVEKKCLVRVSKQKYCDAVSFLTSFELSTVSRDLRVMTSTINISEDYQTQYRTDIRTKYKISCYQERQI